MAYAVYTQLEQLQKENDSIRKDNASIRKDNADLRNIVAAHAAQIERNKHAICQLFGGLYNPTQQKRILKEHLNSLMGASEAETSEAGASEAGTGASDDESDESDDDGGEDLEENIWPTTRQGDEHEKRLKESEERLRQLELQIALAEKRQLEKYGFNM